VTNGGVVTCEISKLAKGASVTKTIVVTANSTGTACNAVSVSSQLSDPLAENDSDSLCTLVTAVPQPVRDLAIVKITAPETVTLTDKKPSQTKQIAVQIQNRSPTTKSSQISKTCGTHRGIAWGLPRSDPTLHNGSPQKALPVTLNPSKS